MWALGWVFNSFWIWIRFDYSTMERFYWWINNSVLEFRRRESGRYDHGRDQKISGPELRPISTHLYPSVDRCMDRVFKPAYVDVLMQTWPQKMKYTTCRTMTYSRYHIQLLELKVCTIDKLFMAFSFLPLKTQFRDFNLRDFRFREFSLMQRKLQAIKIIWTGK